MQSRSWQIRATALAAGVLLADPSAAAASAGAATGPSPAHVAGVGAAQVRNRGGAHQVAGRGRPSLTPQGMPAFWPAAADRAVATGGAVTVAAARAREQRRLPAAGFDGMVVAAVGTCLTGAGWLLMLVGSRRLRRRSR